MSAAEGAPSGQPLLAPEGGQSLPVPAGGYASRATRSRQETNRVYGYVFDRGTAARIESAEVRPRAARRGGEITAVLTYLIFTHSAGEVRVNETRELWIGESMAGRWEVDVSRGGGTYESGVAFRLPRDAAPGPCKVVYIVRTPYSRDLREAGFEIGP